MNKFYALSISTILTLAIFFFTTYNLQESRETVIVSRVIDGDTLKTEDGRTLRLLNINAPEKNVESHEKAMSFLKLLENQSIEIESLGFDKYQRTLVRIYSPEYINLELVRSGLASKFLVQEKELKAFSEAEYYAIKSSLGIWNKSSYFGCIKVDIEKENEIVFLKNNCNVLSIKHWVIKDESRKSYLFGEINLGNISLHSSYGNDNSSDIFWKSSTNIWNNDRDSLYLFDEEGRIVGYETYGY